MVITNVNEKINQLFIITKLNTVFQVFENLEKAKQEISAKSATYSAAE